MRQLDIDIFVHVSSGRRRRIVDLGLLTKMAANGDGTHFVAAGLYERLSIDSAPNASQELEVGSIYCALSASAKTRAGSDQPSRLANRLTGNHRAQSLRLFLTPNSSRIRSSCLARIGDAPARATRSRRLQRLPSLALAGPSMRAVLLHAVTNCSLSYRAMLR